MKAPSTGERLLVERMLAGDEAAFERFFEDHFARLHRFALARTGDADAAEEIVQVTLCNAMKDLRHFRHEAALYTWLCAIGRREIAAWRQRRGREPQPVPLLEEAPEIQEALEALAGAPDIADPEKAIERQELARLVRVALDALPAGHGDALEWKYVHGLSVKEIADRLGLGPKAAESHLTRAREGFRAGFAALLAKRGVTS